MISDGLIPAFKDHVDWGAWSSDCDEILNSDSEPWLILCSGGADSVFLACALYVKFGPDLSRFYLVHFNHGLRANESDRDEEFSKSLAADLGFQFISERFQSIPSSASENDLRKMRLDAVAELTKKTKAKGALFGHHATDAVEWGLMSLFRGAGPSSLSSPASISSRQDGSLFLRPMMGYSREAIRTSLQIAKITWREDSSNENGDYTRNRIRRELLPQLREAIPHSLEKGNARTRILMKEADEAVEFLFEQAQLDFRDSSCLDGTKLKNQPMAVWRRAFYFWVNQHYPFFSSKESTTIDLILKAWSGSEPLETVFSDEKGVLLRLTSEDYKLSIAEPNEAQKYWDGNYQISLSGRYYLPNGAILESTIIQGGELDQFTQNPRQVNPRHTAWIDFGLIRGPFTFSTWKPGDRFQPLGAPGSKKVQDWFVDRKIPLELRGQLPICKHASGEIVWIPGFPPADLLKVSSSTEKALRLTYRLL